MIKLIRKINANIKLNRMNRALNDAMVQEPCSGLRELCMLHMMNALNFGDGCFHAKNYDGVEFAIDMFDRWHKAFIAEGD